MRTFISYMVTKMNVSDGFSQDTRHGYVEKEKKKHALNKTPAL